MIAAHAWYGDTIGGSFRLATDVARYLAAQGHQVVYVCCSDGVNRVSRAVEDGVEIHRYPPPHRGRLHPANLAHHVGQADQIARSLVFSSSAVTVNGHSPLQYRGVLNAFAKRRIAVDSCYSVHSPFDDELLAQRGPGPVSWKTRLAVWAARRLDGSNIRRSSVVQAHSAYTQSVLVEKFGEQLRNKTIIVPGWVNVERFTPCSNRKSSRGELPCEWHTDETIFFTLRRLEPRMGIDTLVKAAARLKAQGMHFRVLIGGDGSQRPQLEQLVSECDLKQHVQFLGRVPELFLSRCYSAADCFVLPTRALECFGLIVLESFASNTPVIASRCGAIPEIASRQGDNWLFEPGQDEQLALRMQQFLSGELQPTSPLRAIAEEFDRPRVLPEWKHKCLTSLRT